MNKTVIITGANGNLGTAVVEKFLSAGWQVIATVAQAGEIESMTKHPKLDARAVNLTNETETAEFVQSVIEKYKSVNAALLLVGGFVAGGIETTSGSDLMKQYSLNFETSYFTARPLFNHMMANNDGRLVFVGARPALKPVDGKSMVAYSLSKSLVFKLAELLNAAAKGKNVTATVIVPSTIDTPMNRKNMPDANFENWVKPQQIAEVMEMICADIGLPLRETVVKIYGNS